MIFESGKLPNNWFEYLEFLCLCLFPFLGFPQILFEVDARSIFKKLHIVCWILTICSRSEFEFRSAKIGVIILIVGFSQSFENLPY